MQVELAAGDRLGLHRDLLLDEVEVAARRGRSIAQIADE
jgi:hypothetical protein